MAYSQPKHVAISTVLNETVVLDWKLFVGIDIMHNGMKNVTVTHLHVTKPRLRMGEDVPPLPHSSSGRDGGTI
jgi:hypothetical protein